MYHGAREVWQGWSKNASFGVEGGAAKALVGGTAALALLAVAAARRVVPRACGGATRRLAAAGAAGTASMAALQRLTTWAVPTPPRYAATLPLGMVVLMAAAIRGGASERLAGRGPALARPALPAGALSAAARGAAEQQVARRVQGHGQALGLAAYGRVEPGDPVGWQRDTWSR